MRLLEEANNRRYLTISTNSDQDTHGICSNFLIPGQAPRPGIFFWPFCINHYGITYPKSIRGYGKPANTDFLQVSCIPARTVGIRC